MPYDVASGATGALSGAATGAALGSAVPVIGNVAGAVIGGLIGLLSGAKDRGASDEELAQIVRDYQNLPLPVQQKITAEQVGTSAMDSVNVDPSLKAAQYAALEKLLAQGESGGLTLGDKANLTLANNEAARQGLIQRTAIQNQMDARGMGNSGANIAMQLGAAHNAEEMAGDNGLKAVALGSHNALDAISRAGALSGQMAGQQFSQDAQKAQARDMWAKYNADARSAANYYNANAGQRDFNNRLEVLNGLSAARRGVAAQDTANANRKQNFWATLGYGAGQVAGGLLRPSQPSQPDGSFPFDHSNPADYSGSPLASNVPSGGATPFYTEPPPSPLQPQNDEENAFVNYFKKQNNGGY